MFQHLVPRIFFLGPSSTSRHVLYVLYMHVHTIQYIHRFDICKFKMLTEEERELLVFYF